MIRNLALVLIAAFSIGSFAAPEILTVKPNESWGKLSVQIRAHSSMQYSPVILCDSFDFQVSHFSSIFRAGILNVDLRYITRGFPQGASCSLFFVEDDLEEFNFAEGRSLFSAPQSFRFVIQ